MSGGNKNEKSGASGRRNGSMPVPALCHILMRVRYTPLPPTLDKTAASRAIPGGDGATRRRATRLAHTRKRRRLRGRHRCITRLPHTRKRWRRRGRHRCSSSTLTSISMSCWCFHFHTWNRLMQILLMHNVNFYPVMF